MSNISPPIYYIKSGSLSFADKIIFEDLEIYLHKSDKICLIGKNGSGKSSLMKIISGDYEIDNGEIFVEPGISKGFLKQDSICSDDISIFDYILQDYNIEEDRYLADIILENLEIDGNLILNNLSGGQRRRVELAKILIKKPDILLLDEPTNHLDIKAIEWLEEYIKSYQGAIICISHDRAFLANITNKIWWLDRGYLRKSNRGYKFFDEWQSEILREEEENLRKLDKKLAEENLWLNQGISARRKRNQKRLASLKTLRTQLQNHKNHLLSAKQKIQFELDDHVKKSNFIIEAESINFSYKNKAILKDFSIRVKKGEKIGVIGPNGSGKSTLIKIITGELKPESGRIKLGNNIDITYFDQHRSDLNNDHTIWRTMCPLSGDRVFFQDGDMHVAAYLKKFMFDPKILQNKVSTLSGGEKNRLLLAKALTKPGNFLILDEPTNDLDMDSLELLLEILADYNGTLFVVSHDRDFLEKLVTRTLVLTEENNIIDLIGGYEDYLKFYKKDISQKDVKKIKSVEKTSAHIEKKDEDNSKPQKLSYKYVRLLEILPQEIEKLENDIMQIEKELCDENLYKKNPEKFQKFTKLLEDSKKLLEDKFQLWIEIENMKNNL